MVIRTMPQAFMLAFVTDGQMLVKSTRPFELQSYHVPAGAIGKVLDIVRDHQLMLVDFGVTILARIPIGSDLVEAVHNGQ